MKPLTRLENFLAKIAGDPDAKMDMKPKTRKEMYLDAIANGSGGGSGGSGSGTMKVIFVTLPGETGETVTVDKTFEELYQAVQNGAYVYAVREASPIIYHLMSATEQGVAFSYVSVGTEVVQDVLGVESDNRAVRMTRRYPNEWRNHVQNFLVPQ